MQTAALEGKIKAGHVLVAEESVGWASPTIGEEVGDAPPYKRALRGRRGGQCPPYESCTNEVEDKCILDSCEFV
jgi:hypothetical protein